MPEARSSRKILIWKVSGKVLTFHASIFATLERWAKMLCCYQSSATCNFGIFLSRFFQLVEAIPRNPLRERQYIRTDPQCTQYVAPDLWRVHKKLAQLRRKKLPFFSQQRRRRYFFLGGGGWRGVWDFSLSFLFSSETKCGSRSIINLRRPTTLRKSSLGKAAQANLLCSSINQA